MEQARLGHKILNAFISIFLKSDYIIKKLKIDFFYISIIFKILFKYVKNNFSLKK